MKKNNYVVPEAEEITFVADSQILDASAGGGNQGGGGDVCNTDCDDD